MKVPVHKSVVERASKLATRRSERLRLSGGFHKRDATELFQIYSDPTLSDRISYDGINKLCVHLDIEYPETYRGLVMLWRLHALSEPGTISLEEFLAGMEGLNVSTLEALKVKAYNWRAPHPSTPGFEKYPEMVFKFCVHKAKTGGLITGPTAAFRLAHVFPFVGTPNMSEVYGFLDEEWRQKIDLCGWMELVKFLMLRDYSFASYHLHTWSPLIKAYIKWAVKNNYIDSPPRVRRGK